MEAVATELDAISAIGGTSTAPFAEVYVTLTKLEHIQLVMCVFQPIVDGISG